MEREISPPRNAPSYQTEKLTLSYQEARKLAQSTIKKWKTNKNNNNTHTLVQPFIKLQIDILILFLTYL